MRLVIDTYSGRPNPQFDLPGFLADPLFELIADTGLIKNAGAPFPGRLGFRGLEIELPPSISARYRLSPWLNISADVLAGEIRFFNELLSIATLGSRFGFGERLLNLIRRIINALLNPSRPASGGAPVPTGPCDFEILPYDPGFWNDPAFVRTNNCYAYAANKRAPYPRKPQPGIGSGGMFSSNTGAAVRAAAIRDGAHDVGDCFPPSEAPRLLVALVAFPDDPSGVNDDWDYHWYRKHQDFWGHKPGGTPARNIDGSGVVITNPQTCNRDGYTQFVGFMLIPVSQRVAA